LIETERGMIIYLFNYIYLIIVTSAHEGKHVSYDFLSETYFA
jgi:hypothetical protein